MRLRRILAARAAPALLAIGDRTETDLPRVWQLRSPLKGDGDGQLFQHHRHHISWCYLDGTLSSKTPGTIRVDDQRVLVTPATDTFVVILTVHRGDAPAVLSEQDGDGLHIRVGDQALRYADDIFTWANPYQ